MRTYVKGLIFFTMILFFTQCKKERNVGCDNLKCQRVYAERMGANGKTSYEHYILIPEYSNKCFPLINFLSIAKSYRDTCRSFTPVRAVSFLKSVEGTGFDDNELDPIKISEHRIIGFGIDSLTVTSVYISNGGFRKVVRIEGCEWKE